MSLLEGDVVDVVDNHYMLQTNEGTVQVPVGFVEMTEGAIIGIGENKYLRIHLPPPEAEQNSENDVVLNTPPLREDRNIAEWPEKPTKLLIDIYRQHKHLVEERKIKTLKKMWEMIRDQINSKGYNYTSQQCESKWKSLERAFKNKVDKSKKTGRGRTTCPYERELAEILLKRKSIIPPLVLDASTEKCALEMIRDSGAVTVQNKTFITQESELVEENNQLENSINPPTRAGPSTTPEPLISAGPSNKSQQSPQLTKRKKYNVRMEVQKLREVIEKRFEDKMAMEKKTYELKQKFLEQLTRKNDLLERLLNRDG